MYEEAAKQFPDYQAAPAISNCNLYQVDHQKSELFSKHINEESSYNLDTNQANYWLLKLFSLTQQSDMLTPPPQQGT